MELRWGSSVGSALLLLLGLLIAWPFVAGAMSAPTGDMTLTVGGSAIVEDLASLADAPVQPQAISTEAVGPASVAEEGPSLPPTSLEQPPVSRVTGAFVAELRSARLSVSANGDRVLTETVGPGSARQLVLSQVAADRFGITRNPFFDPMRVAVIRNGEAVVDLATGVIMGHEIGSAMFGTTEVIGMDVLEQLRDNVGWSLASARKFEAAMYERILGYIPEYLQSDEAYALYKESARANYEVIAEVS